MPVRLRSPCQETRSVRAYGGEGAGASRAPALDVSRYVRELALRQVLRVYHVAGIHDFAAAKDLMLAGDLSTPIGVVYVKTPTRLHVARCRGTGTGGGVFFSGCGSHTSKAPAG